MVQIRRHISNLAALVLLVWLFACGAAVAQNCLTHADAHAGSGGCCATTVHAAAVRADAGSEMTAPAPMQPFVGTMPGSWKIQPYAAPQEDVLLPPWQGSSLRIPIVFLRLAL